MYLAIEKFVNDLNILPSSVDFQNAIREKIFSKYHIESYLDLSYIPNEILDFLFQNSIDRISRLSNQESKIFISKILDSLVDKLKTNVGNPEWTTREYLIFYNSIRTLKEQQLSMSRNTVLMCLSMNSSESLKVLNDFANKTDFYPDVERVYNTEKKKYDIFPKKIEQMDLYRNIPMIHSRILMFIRKEADRLCASFDDFEILHSTLLDIESEVSEIRRNALLAPFCKEFSYLRETPVYLDLYIQYREKYIHFLLKTCFDRIRLEASKNSIERRTCCEMYMHHRASCIKEAKKRKKGGRYYGF